MKINICEFKGEIAKRGKKNPTELLLFYAIHATPFISMCLGTYSFIKLINLNSFFFFFLNPCNSWKQMPLFAFSMNVLSELSMCSPLNVLYVFF